MDENYHTYHDIFQAKLKKCKSKKDYKRLCKQMVFQLDVIDKIDENQRRIISSIVGSDNYTQIMAMAIKMFILEQQGMSVDILPCTENMCDFDI